MITKQDIEDLKQIQKVYCDLYTQYDPEGEIAVHAEFDNKLSESGGDSEES